MELQFYGANCVRITSRKFSLVIDDNLDKLGLKNITKPTDIFLRTSLLIDNQPQSHFQAELPGEYEISGAIIRGIAARSHLDEEGKKTAVIYTIETEDTRVGVLGHIYPQLSEDQLEQMGMLDVLFTPVGGNGFTLDAAGALSVLKQIEPKFVIPTHYADKAIKYEVPQAELSEAIKGLGMEPIETLTKFKTRTNEPGDTTKLVILERE